MQPIFWDQSATQKNICYVPSFFHHKTISFLRYASLASHREIVFCSKLEREQSRENSALGCAKFCPKFHCTFKKKGKRKTNLRLFIEHTGEAEARRLTRSVRTSKLHATSYCWIHLDRYLRNLEPNSIVLTWYNYLSNLNIYSTKLVSKIMWWIHTHKGVPPRQS